MQCVDLILLLGGTFVRDDQLADLADLGTCTRTISAWEIRYLGKLAPDLSCSHCVGGDVATHGFIDGVPLCEDAFTVPMRGLARYSKSTLSVDQIL